MSDDLGFEPIDEELRRRLGAAAPTGDPDAALSALRSRLEHAQHRHRTIVAVGSAFVVATIGAAVGSIVPGGGRDVRILPAGGSRPLPTATSRPSTPTSSSVPDDHGGNDHDGDGSDGDGSGGDGSGGDGAGGGSSGP